MVGERSEYSEIRRSSVWTNNFAKALQEAHALGHGPSSEIGGCMLDADFQARSAAVLAQTIPQATLKAFARQSELVAQTMVAVDLPEEIDRSLWIFLTRWFHDVSRYISDGLGTTFPSRLIETEPSNVQMPFSPAVLPILELATVASRAAVDELEHASREVAEALSSASLPGCPLTAEQIEMLKGIADGKRVVDIAEQAHRAERSVQRDLREIWRLLGVESRLEGVSLAAKSGWI